LNLEPGTCFPRRDATANAVSGLGYDVLRVMARCVAVWLFGLRVLGREHWPEGGGGLVCANHQSHFDPPLVGMTCSRRMNYLARDTLFNVPGLKQLIHFLDAIPIDREGGGLAGLKETLRRLKAGELVLIFPEGTRTHDGEVAPLKPGFIAVARRSRVPLIPVGVDGAFQAWPHEPPAPPPAARLSSSARQSDPTNWSHDRRGSAGGAGAAILTCHSQARERHSTISHQPV
jgi:1-acyl-sn-glycerol-3-phosphate acyltransferase